jgi:hypothetical protein
MHPSSFRPPQALLFRPRRVQSRSTKVCFFVKVCCAI